jgi:phytanoyl-CoA hydroxylase
MRTLEENDDWTFRLSFDEGSSKGDDCSKSDPHPLKLPLHIQASFQQDGFAVFQRVITPNLVEQLNAQLEKILRGDYNRGHAPDKIPKLIKRINANSAQHAPLGFSGNLQNVKVVQVINVHKSDHLFRQLACNPLLGQVVARLAGWTSTRLAQDQIWAKPPGAPPLSFHRDSPYFMFQPRDVVTVWVALDDMDAELGPLEYVRGSHVWGDERIGSSQQFFQTKGGRDLLESAAQAHGVSATELDSRIVSMAGLAAGSISIHNGRTWHGSGKNNSKHRPRRGLGIHYVPGHVKFTEDARKSRLWRPYIENAALNDMAVPDDDFPMIWEEG